MWSYEAIESDDETDQSGGMEEDSEHPRLSPASGIFFTKKERKGLVTELRVMWLVILGWKKKVELGTGRIVTSESRHVDISEEVWNP